jgi:hypothetical protein
MSDPHVTPPAGAWSASHQPPAPRAGHAGVIGVSIGLAVALIAGSSAVGGAGLVALLMLLLAGGSLVVPVAVMVVTWAQATLLVRVLFAVAGIACLVVLAFAVTGIVTVAPTLWS